MEGKEASAPFRNCNNARGGSPPHPQQRNSRAAYNNWASRRSRGAANSLSPNSPAVNLSGNHQRQRGNVRLIGAEPESPDLANSVPTEDLPQGSNELGLNRIGHLLEEIDSAIPDDSVINVINDTPQHNFPHPGPSECRTPNVQTSGHRTRARPRRRLPLNTGSSLRGGTNNGTRNSDNNYAGANQAPPNNTSPSRLNRPNAFTRIGRIAPPPLRFGPASNFGELSSDSSDDLSTSDSHFAPSRPQIRPLQVNTNPFLQGLGTEDNPFELSPDSPEISPSLFGPDGGGNSNSSTSNNISGTGSSNRRRGGGRGRGSNGRNRGAHAGNDRNCSGGSPRGLGRAGASAGEPPASLVEILSPPISDEELARRLQEEEWQAASDRADDLDAALLRNLDSPLHLFGGYHRRRPRLHLPPLLGVDEGNSGGASADSVGGAEELHPFFFDGPPGGSRGRARRGQRLQRNLPNLAHPLQALFELRRDDSLLFDLVANEAMIPPDELSLFEGEEASGRLYESLIALADTIGEVSQGLPQAEINKLPTRKHKSSSASENDGASAGGATGGAPLPSDQLQCNICLCDYENGDQKRLLPCKHDFHKDCVDTWLKSKATCPVCRSDVKPKRS
ncbi:RING finger protein [Plakobranchus ocellatus]|uniref:RING finger protein n=1 Tax=Plakobranchus ocellatus TaxID=259542 RepID=A0AAV4BC59_9GAST|nr:RING finger protein [Plakobranchus ocellatus]